VEYEHIYQGIVLIVGAVILLIVVFKTFEGGKIHYIYSIKAIVKGVGVEVQLYLSFLHLKE